MATNNNNSKEKETGLYRKTPSGEPRKGRAYKGITKEEIGKLAPVLKKLADYDRG